MDREEKMILGALSMVLIIVIMVLTSDINRVKVSNCNGMDSFSYTTLYSIKTNKVKIENDPRCVLALKGHNYNLKIEGDK